MSQGYINGVWPKSGPTSDGKLQVSYSAVFADRDSSYVSYKISGARGGARSVSYSISHEGKEKIGKEDILSIGIKILMAVENNELSRIPLGNTRPGMATYTVNDLLTKLSVAPQRQAG